MESYRNLAIASSPGTTLFGVVECRFSARGGCRATIISIGMHSLVSCMFFLLPRSSLLGSSFFPQVMLSLSAVLFALSLERQGPRNSSEQVNLFGNFS